MERILEHIVECKIGENQRGFRKGRGTDDGLFVIRQIIEKRRESIKYVTFGFVNLEQAFDIVPRELTFAVMRWMEVGETEVRMVEVMVMNLISGKVSEQEEFKKILYADDL